MKQNGYLRKMTLEICLFDTTLFKVFYKHLREEAIDLASNFGQAKFLAQNSYVYQYLR